MSEIKISYRQSTLENGLRVVTARLPFWRSLSLGVFAGAGSRHDPQSRQGLAHFTEHMLFKGTAQRSAKRIVTQAEAVGGSLNAYTSEEHTCYHVRSPAGHLTRMVGLLADMYGNSTFPEEEIQRERQVIEDEIHMYRDEPGSHIDDLLSAIAWPKHALGRPILGTLKSLAQIERDDFSSHLKRSYGARNTVVALAGPQNHDRMVDTVAAAFAALPPGRRRRAPRFQRRPAGRGADSFWVEDRAIEQVHLRLGFHAEGRHDAQLYPGRLLSVLLGETMSSRLSQELREKRGYCYSVGSGREAFQDTGIFTIHASFEPRFLRQVLTQIGRQLRRLREQPPGPRELRAAFQHVSGGHEMGLEETASQMFWLGDSAIHGDEDLDPERYLHRLSTVTPAAVQKVARKIFLAKNLCGALLGPQLEQQREEIIGWCRDSL